MLGDKESINQLIGDSGFSGKIGILSIDIDGNDYWVWESISVVDPVIVVVEWNSVFGPKHAVTTPYSAEFNRAKAHYSCLYWGASMRAFEILGERKGYQLVGSNALGNNIFFIKKKGLVGWHLLLLKTLMWNLNLEIQETNMAS